MTDTDALMAGLEPCPFCGAEAEMEPWHGGGPDKQLISCSGVECEASPAVTGETPGEAVANWNRRAPHPTETRLREALERLYNRGWHDAHFYGGDGVKNASAAVEECLSAQPVQPEAGEDVYLQWRDGAPPKPWSNEWFIAMTIYGDRVVLRTLPEEWSYDFTTADETYMKAENIKRWMQFPDSEYVSHSTPRPSPTDVREAVAWMYERNGCYVLKKNRTPEYTTPVMGHTETPLYATPTPDTKALRQALELAANRLDRCAVETVNVGGTFALAVSEWADEARAALQREGEGR